MKKVLLIGKLNDTVKELNTYLSKRFSVQISSEIPAVLEGMIKVVNPDIMIMSLIGANEGFLSVFSMLQNNYPYVPVITLGTEAEVQPFSKFYSGGQFFNVSRPFENKEVLEAICACLGISEPDAVSYEESSKKKVLVVDDNAATLRSLKTILDKTYDVSVATSGMKAMAAIGKKKPDLILLDYEMPVCDGKQTLEMIRADEELGDIPVIFLTSVNGKEHIRAVIMMHPAGYLLKPVKTETLKSTIASALKSVASEEDEEDEDLYEPYEDEDEDDTDEILYVE